jgi:hypothetical protein
MMLEWLCYPPSPPAGGFGEAKKKCSLWKKAATSDKRTCPDNMFKGVVSFFGELTGQKCKQF